MQREENDKSKEHKTNNNIHCSVYARMRKSNDINPNSQTNIQIFHNNKDQNKIPYARFIEKFPKTIEKFGNFIRRWFFYRFIYEKDRNSNNQKENQLSYIFSSIIKKIR